MRKSLRGIAATAAVAVIALAAPLAGHAGYCDSQVVIFSRPASVNGNAGVCVVDPGVDTRLINPGSNGVSVRYLTDLGAIVPKVIVVLNGMGFTNKQIEAKRTTPTGGSSSVYDTATINFAAGNTATGCLTADVYDPADTDFVEALDTTTFHTVDQQATGC